MAGNDCNSCDDALDALYWFIDGELTDERRVAIQRHLDDCAGCFDAFDFEVELRMVVSLRCRDRVPESLRQRIAWALDQAAGR